MQVKWVLVALDGLLGCATARSQAPAYCLLANKSSEQWAVAHPPYKNQYAACLLANKLSENIKVSCMGTAVMYTIQHAHPASCAWHAVCGCTGALGR